MNPIKFLPWLTLTLVLLFVGRIASEAMRSHDQPGKMPYDALGRLLVSDGGRTKPLDTFARSSLLKLNGRQTFEVDGTKRPAIEWLMEVWGNPELAETRPVFRIDHPDVLAIIGVSQQDRTRFSWKEISPHFPEIVKQAELAFAVTRKKQDPFQRHIADLYNKLSEYTTIRDFRKPYVVAPFAPGEEWAPLINQEGTALAEGESAKAVRSIIIALAAKQGETQRLDDLAKAVAEYEKAIALKLPSDDRAAGLEVIFNRAAPFSQTSALYVLAFILGCAGLLIRPLSPDRWSVGLNKSASMVLIVSFAIHTIGLIARIYLQGRPPVTNLYSSAVFIGWACIPIALLGEWMTRSGLLQLVAALIGFATLIVAHNLGQSGDTMEMMQAVLDTNFWLATHVVVVTIGYSATFLAGFLACLYALGGVLTPLLKGEPMKALPRMIYGVICFASITSFVGTVLGGIWADQSWGRFWGWDPKENGAAMIVVWNLLILHARWGGMIKDRGVAALAIVGNIVTAWSWFGTNMLGVGLHSYGFMDSAVFWIVAFALSQLAVMGIALVPTEQWKSLSLSEPRS